MNKKNKSNKSTILMELRPCFEGFAGIPQETRLVFQALNDMNNVEVTGLLNHPNRSLQPGLWRHNIWGKLKPHRRVHRLSRLAISVKVDPIVFWWDKVVLHADKFLETKMHSTAARFGIGVRLYDFDAEDFGDFIWQTLFSKTLPARDFEQIRNARYASIKPSWDLLTNIAIKRMKSMVAFRGNKITMLTKGCDIFLAQTPWPTAVHRDTQLVVRYHDAIPLFLPHTISKAPRHQFVHMASLLENSKRGIFACTSRATREDLLKVFPNLEKRSVVIPDIVSHEYYEESGNDRYISNIIRNHVAVETEPKFLTSREKENFYQRYLMSKPIKFIMMVSTLEPRKNHTKLLAAWDYLKNHGMPDLKLILVGECGWEEKRIIDAMAPWQQRGELFHIHRVPSGQLRILYNAAEAVVCPSVAEGFDLSGIEAMLCGGAVVASDIPVHREVYVDACEYFNPYSTIDQAKAIENVIHPDRSSRREELVEAGFRHAPRYKRENIMPLWHEFFEKIRGGAFKKASNKEYPHVLPAPEPLPAFHELANDLDEIAVGSGGEKGNLL